MEFIEPSHGAKGKQRIVDDDDLCDMYKTYKGKKDIMLWVTTFTRSWVSSNGKKTKYDVHTHKMMEVEEIANDLQTRHENHYTWEQYTTWFI